MRRSSYFFVTLAAAWLCGCAHTPNPATVTAAQRAALAEEIKTDQDAVNSIKDEISGDDKSAADAEALAKNPPANVADSDRAAFIDQRKNEEQMLQDAAGDARQRLTEAQKSLDDAKARLKAIDDHH